ncbi:MEI2-like 5 [Olea europaea subsp. europaea]|uniref:MEI2-like 5 n=1 Tax=Olea europaea subsp. europaea TaxID=158383 RepID=A0A8S0VF48_OLEEU|nr:MEI2-like 5 [Olea europaea subsp. europaea]
METRIRDIFPRFGTYRTTNDASLFSSSLPVLPHEMLNLREPEHVRPIEGASSGLNKLHAEVEYNDLLKDIDNSAIGSSLPDDEDELLAGIMGTFDLGGLPNHMDNSDEYDLFGSGGGLELESDPQENLDAGFSKASPSDGVVGNGVVHYGLLNGMGTVAGEHPLGEHPSRTLFVRNINSNVEDSELRSLFEQHGDIRTLYTACKHRGFVMISYYDIRAAQTAMRALQNKPLRRRKLDIHFSIPKENPSDKDINQGTLVVFNLDPSVSIEDLRQIFGAYGEVKEIRETPHKRHHKFIEFYDVRCAEVALRSLNRSEIAGKRIKLEPSRPGGARRSLMLQPNQDLEQDESRSLRHQLGSPIRNSPPGDWPPFGSPMEHSSMSPPVGKSFPGLAAISQLSNSAKLASIGNDYSRGSHLEHLLKNRYSSQRGVFEQSHSFPEQKSGLYSGNMPSFVSSSSNRPHVETLSGPQFLWGSPKLFPDQSNSSSWKAQPVRHPFTPNGHQRLSYTDEHKFLNYSSQSNHHHNHHNIGSAPSGIPFEQQSGFYQESPEASFLSRKDWNFMVNMDARGAMNSGSVYGNRLDTGSSSFGMMSSPRLSPMFLDNGHFPGLTAMDLEGPAERGRSRLVVNNGNQMDNREQFQLDLDKIRKGEDTRTTLMIKNIPNKYTAKMLLATIDEHHKSTYDFLYLPIDFKNKCNVGYAFINMLSPSHIISFYEAFNGKKWEKFNSEKVACLAYARIQGTAALVAHFQNSSLMNEDKRCRPILFHPESSESGNQQQQMIQGQFFSRNLNVQACQSKEMDPTNSPGSSSKGYLGAEVEKQ